MIDAKPQDTQLYGPISACIILGIDQDRDAFRTYVEAQSSPQTQGPNTPFRQIPEEQTHLAATILDWARLYNAFLLQRDRMRVTSDELRVTGPQDHHPSLTTRHSPQEIQCPT